jgi:phosphomethylpyrimidine synthase
MTRVEQAKAGIITPEFETAAKQERLTPQQLVKALADGSVVIARNTQRSIDPLVIGAGTRIKINANIGSSSAKADLGEELAKLRIAVKYGADAVMDLSTAGDIGAIRTAVLAECPVAVGTVPLYEMALSATAKKRSEIGRAHV